ncbi:glutamyl-tRNA reductase [candidate division BRC1 bacterium HGW-BRC1-1]|nr:MAG: glutamyl-tRNA reductase [candidate division BRC1 bacterium HGW-BRC1-1]
MRITITGLSHRTAPVGLRERFAFDADPAQALQELRRCDGVHGAVILSTCNRVELVTLEEAPAAGKSGSASFLGQWFGIPEAEYIDYIYRLHDDQAVRHLFRVAAGLDSMVLGEAQILGQVRRAYLSSQEAGTSGGHLCRLFERALETGKRVRTSTTIGRHAGTVPHAAVDLTKTVFRSLEGRTAAVLGRGEAGQMAAQRLQRAGVSRLLVVNRCLEAAERFAASVGGEPRLFDEELSFLHDVDLLLCCSRTPYPVVGVEAMRPIAQQRGERLLLVIDISVPRGVDTAVGSLDNVLRYDIDDLQARMEEASLEHAAAVAQATDLVENETTAFSDWCTARRRGSVARTRPARATETDAVEAG